MPGLWPENIPDDILAAMRAPRDEDDFRKYYMQQFVPDDRGSGRTRRQLLRLREDGLFVVWDEREQVYVTRRLIEELQATVEGFVPPKKVLTVYQFADSKQFTGQRWGDFDVDHMVWPKLSNGSFSKETRFRDTVHQFLKWARIEEASMFRGEPT